MNADCELRLLQDSWTKVFQTYLTWFTWNFNTHILILGGVLSIQQLQRNSVLIAFLTLMFALLAVGASIAMLVYHNQIRHRAAELEPTTEAKLVFGGALSGYMRISTLLTNLILVAAWGFLLLAQLFSVVAADK
jgi:hypothetical protein